MVQLESSATKYESALTTEYKASIDLQHISLYYAGIAQLLERFLAMEEAWS